MTLFTTLHRKVGGKNDSFDDILALAGDKCYRNPLRYCPWQHDGLASSPPNPALALIHAFSWKYSAVLQTCDRCFALNLALDTGTVSLSFTNLGKC